MSGTGADPFAGTPPPPPVTWAHTFDFRESAGGFTPLVRSGSDYRAVYTTGVGFTHGNPYTNVIQIQSAFLAQTTLILLPFLIWEYTMRKWRLIILLTILTAAIMVGILFLLVKGIQSPNSLSKLNMTETSVNAPNFAVRQAVMAPVTPPTPTRTLSSEVMTTVKSLKLTNGARTTQEWLNLTKTPPASSK